MFRKQNVAAISHPSLLIDCWQSYQDEQNLCSQWTGHSLQNAHLQTKKPLKGGPMLRKGRQEDIKIKIIIVSTDWWIVVRISAAALFVTNAAGRWASWCGFLVHSPPPPHYSSFLQNIVVMRSIPVTTGNRTQTFRQVPSLIESSQHKCS